MRAEFTASAVKTDHSERLMHADLACRTATTSGSTMSTSTKRCSQQERAGVLQDREAYVLQMGRY